MFLLTFTVVNLAPTRQRLENDVFTVSGIAQKYNCALKRLDWQAVLDGKVDMLLVNSIDRIGREWGMTQAYIDLLTQHKVKLLCIRDRLLFDKQGVTCF